MTTVDELHELMMRKEDLHPALVPYVEEDSELGWSMLRSPLVYQIPYSPQMNALANAQYLAKREGCREALRQRKWHRYVFLHERPYRLDAFEAICWRGMGDRKYWNLLGNIWTDSENIRQNMDSWRECLTAPRRYRSYLMDEDERKALRHDIDLHNGVIYRGFRHPGMERGLSWTTNSIVAKFFARRLAQPGEQTYIAEGRVDRRDIIAFFDGRSEYECVVLPENVRDIQIREVPNES